MGRDFYFHVYLLDVGKLNVLRLRTCFSTLHTGTGFKVAKLSKQILKQLFQPSQTSLQRPFNRRFKNNENEYCFFMVSLALDSFNFSSLNQHKRITSQKNIDQLMQLNI